jgi:hypothetical protein
MSRIRSSSWSSFLLGVGAAAVAVGSGVPAEAASASSPPPTSATAVTQESAGYATPEDAVSAYMGVLQQADLGAMTSAFAIETYVANYDLTADLTRIKAYVPTAPIKLPPSDPFNVALNTESRRAQVVGGVLNQYLRLCCPDLDRSNVQALPDDAAVTSLVDELAASASSDVLTSIDTFTFVPLDDVSADTFEAYSSDRNEQNITGLEAILGADELTDLAVRFTTPDGDVYALFGVVRYGDQWWVHELGGTFAALLGLGFFDGGIVPAGQADETVTAG